MMWGEHSVHTYQAGRAESKKLSGETEFINCYALKNDLKTMFQMIDWPRLSDVI